jgi:hypothetical protein
MTAHKSTQTVDLLVRARWYLRVSQGALGELLGVSQRTGQRWETTGATPSGDQWIDLARRIHPHDVALSNALARKAGHTLRSLGLPSSPSKTVQGTSGKSASAPGLSTASARSVEHAGPEIVDSVVCAAAEAMGVMPSAIRPALQAAFVRMQKLGLEVDEVVQGLGRDEGKKSTSRR